ncbi:MAG: carboxypeptidase-like regulatory domain-containing protein [Byssovorax sp.]
MRAPRLLPAALIALATGLAMIAPPLAAHAQTPPGMPAGHPPIDDGDDGDDGDMPPGDSPHGANPHGAAGAGNAPKMFRPPADGSQDDTSLPVGSLVVSIRDAQDQPIAKAPITLNIVHSSVARGESRETRSAQGDENGAARFDGLPFGSGVSFQVSTTRGPASYSVMPFPLNDKNGKRVILHAYDVSNDIEKLPIGTEGFVYLALKEDAIQVEQMFTVLNLGSTTWVADLPIDLPAGFRAFNKQDSPDEARIEEVKGKGAALRGSFGPGRHELMFRYQVPLDDEPKQSMTMELPPHMFQAEVLAEASKSMGLEVADFPGAQRTQNQQGKRVLATEKQFPRKEGKQTLTITLTGLPTTGPGRWIAVVLAVVALGFGAAYYTQSRKDEGLDEEARRDLLDAREALLTEIVTLEKAHKAGEIGPKSYAQFRTSLLDALARIETMLDAGKKPRSAHPFRSAEGAA